MRRQNYYLASRAPSRGGLKIIRTDHGFPDEYADFIEKNCLEIAVPEYAHNALLIYPLGNGKNVVSLARKVKASKWEPRVHENIHGYVLKAEEFSQNYLNAIAEKGFDDCFYAGKMEEAVTLADAEICRRPSNLRGGSLEKFWQEMSYRDKIGFFYAVYRVLSEDGKVQLAVPAHIRRTVQAACYDILPYYCRNKLFTISAGECTQSDADILFVDEIRYQDPGRYTKMDLRTFIERGMDGRKKGLPGMDRLVSMESAKRAEIYEYMDRILKSAEEGAEQAADRLLMSPAFYDLLMELITALEKEEYLGVHEKELLRKFEKVTAGNKKIRELLHKEFAYLKARPEKVIPAEMAEESDQIEVCLNYVKKPQPSKTAISRVRSQISKKEGWETFQKELRFRLEEMPLLPGQRANYVSVLFLAYEYYGGSHPDPERAILPAPYDLEGMLLFLLRKTRSRWEYKKYTEEVLRQYAEVFLLYLPERKVKRAARKINGCMGKYLTEDMGGQNV